MFSLFSSKAVSRWFPPAAEAMRMAGIAVVEEALPPAFLGATRHALYRGGRG
jgi:hypothetical protein